MQKYPYAKTPIIRKDFLCEMKISEVLNLDFNKKVPVEVPPETGTIFFILRQIIIFFIY